MADPITPATPDAPQPEAPQPISPEDYRSLLKGEALGHNTDDEQFALDTMRSRNLVPSLRFFSPKDPWWGMAENAYGTPHGLVLSMAQQESRLDPERLSGTGHQGGILQFTDPATRDRFGINDRNWTNPYLQIDRANRYLSELYGQHKSWDRAVTAYNGGGDPNYLQNVNHYYRGGPFNYQGIVYDQPGPSTATPQPPGTSAAPPGAPSPFEPATTATPAPIPGVPWFKQPTLQTPPAGGVATPPAAAEVPWFKQTTQVTPTTPPPEPAKPIPGTFLGKLEEGGFEYPHSLGEVGRDVLGAVNPIAPLRDLATIARGGVPPPPQTGGRTIGAAASVEPALAYATALSAAHRWGYSDERARHLATVAYWTAILAPAAELGGGAALAGGRAIGRRIGAAGTDLREAAFGTGARAAKAQNVAIDLANKTAIDDRKVNLQRWEEGNHAHLTQMADPEAQHALDQSRYTLDIGRQQHLQDIRDLPMTDFRGRPLGPAQREDLITHLRQYEDPRLFNDAHLRSIVEEGGQRTIGHAPDPAAAWRGAHERTYAWVELTRRSLTEANDELALARKADSIASRVSHLENAQQAWDRVGMQTPPSVQRVLDSHQGMLRHAASPVPSTPHVPIPEASTAAKLGVKAAKYGTLLGAGRYLWSHVGGPAATLIGHVVGGGEGGE
jgi:hypothetical protein